MSPESWLCRRRRGAWILGLLACVVAADAAEPRLPQEVARWRIAVSPPPDSQRKAREAWFYAANYSDIDWHVAADERGHVLADREASNLPTRNPRPAFTPKAGRFFGGKSFARVDDGWLVGFNKGEFGAALYWFSTDGQQNYKISDHPVVDFFSLTDGIHAIEGHVMASVGSIIRIVRSGAASQWQAATVSKLASAPYAVSVRRDGSQLITLSASLVLAEKDGRVVTLLSQPFWGLLYPTSSVLSADERRLYIGMRQYVVEVDLSAKAVRYLVPSRELINQDTHLIN